MTININFDTHLENLKNSDSEVYEAVMEEINRQENTLELIPSENVVTSAIMETQGSVLTNKYSEGYPGKRYYGGNKFIAKVSVLSINLFPP